MTLTIAFKWDDGADTTLGLPIFATVGAAGADICANLPDRAPITLTPGDRTLVSTGFSMAIPQGYEVQIRPRSGLALRYGITLLNSPGTIDSDYRGPLGVVVINHGSDAFMITHGMRIAQMVVAPVIRPGFAVQTELDKTLRDAGGFGSTGI